jgi:hypothetical protein
MTTRDEAELFVELLVIENGEGPVPHGWLLRRLLAMGCELADAQRAIKLAAHNGAKVTFANDASAQFGLGAFL